MSQQSAAVSMADNSFRPAGALVFPEALTGPQRGQFLAAFTEKVTGNLKSNSVMVLDGGVKFETFAVPSKDSEFLESRKLSNLDICRIFGVPPSSAGITDNATYSNIGDESKALVVRCLAPWARRLSSR